MDGISILHFAGLLKGPRGVFFFLARSCCVQATWLFEGLNRESWSTMSVGPMMAFLFCQSTHSPSPWTNNVTRWVWTIVSWCVKKMFGYNFWPLHSVGRELMFPALSMFSRVFVVLPEPSNYLECP